MTDAPGVVLEELVQQRVVSVEELVCIVSDCSGSMTETNQTTGRIKWEELSEHLTDPVNGLIARLQNSSKRDAFYVAMVTFDDKAIAREPRALKDCAPADVALRMSDHGGSTAIGNAMLEAKRMGERWMSESSQIPRIVTCLVASDGLENQDTDPSSVATAVKNTQGFTVATAAYGETGGVGDNLLRDMASRRPDGSLRFKRVKTGEELRDFFAESSLSAKAAVAA